MNKSVALLFAAAVLAAAQHGHHQTPEPAKPAALLEGLGTHSHPIRTGVPLAQKFFDQGLALIYGFNHDEAARLFARAAELDPKSPMPHWGIALALGPNYNMPPMPEREAMAWRAIEKAVELAPAAPEKERAYIEALVKRYSKDPAEDRRALAVKYRDAMREVMRRYPDDLDAATLYAEACMNLRPWQLYSHDGTPAEGTPEIVEVLERVMRRDPNHPGANHYYIHAVEASRTPERALPSAMRLGSIMPGAGHMVHMPSHIFLRVGDYEQSASVNVTAAEVDRRYIERSGARGIYPLMYYSHNLHFVSYARMHQGRYEDAIDYARRLRRNVAGEIDNMGMLAPYGSFEWVVLTRFGRWTEMLAEPEPAEQNNYLRAMYRYARGLAFSATGKVAEAEAERERMGTLCARIPADEMLMVNTARSVLDVALSELDARIARAKGQREAELAHWRRAVEFQDKLNYMEPPDWHFSSREGLGAALLRQGNAAEAEQVFRRDLELHPRHGRALFGLMESLKAQNNADGLEWVRREHAEAWKQAAVELRVDEM